MEMLYMHHVYVVHEIVKGICLSKTLVIHGGSTYIDGRRAMQLINLELELLCLWGW